MSENKNGSSEPLPRSIQAQLKDVKDHLPFEAIPRSPSEGKTPLVYRGGKSKISTWVINFFPPHHTFVDVFGGGAAISLAKNSSTVDIYNDIGDVSKFFEVLRNYGDDLYRFLTFYPFSREAFQYAVKQKQVMEATVFPSWDVEGYEDSNRPYKVRWAAYYYIVILQSFRHEEGDNSWVGTSTQINMAEHFSSHVDMFPEVIKRLRRVVIERKDFLELINQYDDKTTLFYCDPPYLPETWNTKNGYRHMMTFEQHVQLLLKLQTIDGQCVVSGYPSVLYSEYLNEDNGWRYINKTRLQGIKNGNQEGSSRTECLWIREHELGLWTSPDVSGIFSEEPNL